MTRCELVERARPADGPSTDIYKYSQKLRTSSSSHFVVELTGGVAASMMHSRAILTIISCVREVDSGQTKATNASSRGEEPPAGAAAAAGSRPRCRARRAWALVAPMLFVSGGSALVFQVAWMRELRLVFGATTAAVAAVLAIFMAGLGLGSAVLGGGRIGRPIRCGCTGCSRRRWRSRWR